MLQIKVALLTCLLLVAQTVGNWHAYSHLGFHAVANVAQQDAHEQHSYSASDRAIALDGKFNLGNELDAAVCELLDNLCAPTLLRNTVNDVAISIPGIAPQGNYLFHAVLHVGHYDSTGPPPLQI
jgi:hypothetical protein